MSAKSSYYSVTLLTIPRVALLMWIRDLFCSLYFAQFISVLIFETKYFYYFIIDLIRLCISGICRNERRGKWRKIFFHNKHVVIHEIFLFFFLQLKLLRDNMWAQV